MCVFGSSPTPTPLSHQQVVSLARSSCVSLVELNDGEGVVEEPDHTRRESLVLYKPSIVILYFPFSRCSVVLYRNSKSKYLYLSQNPHLFSGVYPVYIMYSTYVDMAEVCIDISVCSIKL
jgi:hypothetical protein